MRAAEGYRRDTPYRLARQAAYWQGLPKDVRQSRQARWAVRVNARFGQLLTDARRRGLSVAITLDDYRSLLEVGACDYCGGHLPPKAGHGVDRKDNARGYEPGNVVPCCTACNRAKGSFFTYAEMKLVMALRRQAELLRLRSDLGATIGG